MRYLYGRWTESKLKTGWEIMEEKLSNRAVVSMSLTDRSDSEGIDRTAFCKLKNQNQEPRYLLKKL